MKLKNKSFIFLVLSIASTMFIFYNSFKTAPESSSSSSDIVSLIINMFSQLKIELDRDIMTIIVRKSAHIAEFFMQGLFIALSYHYSKKKFSEKYINVMFYGLLTATTDELIQNYVNGRGSLVTDIWIDFIGVLVATLVYFIISLYSRRNKF